MFPGKKRVAAGSSLHIRIVSVVDFDASQFRMVLCHDILWQSAIELEALKSSAVQQQPLKFPIHNLPFVS